MRIVRNFVNGEYVEPINAPSYDVYDPGKGSIIARVSPATREEVNQAVDGSLEAQQKWARVPVTDRIKVLFKLENIMQEEMDEIAKVTTVEHGKTLRESKGDIVRAIQNIEAASGATYHSMGRSNRNISEEIDEELIRVPLGVFAVISPFNFPVMIPFWFVPYALALGNGVVIKPSEKTPMSIEMIMGMLKKAGIPDGLVQLVNGGRETVEYLVENSKVAGVSFVGSTGVAKMIYRNGTANGKRVQAGASAKNYVLVMPDADIENNVGNMTGSFFGNAGERCLAGSVLVVFRENHDRVLKSFSKATADLKVGYGLEEGTDIGPLIRKEHLMKVKNHIDEAEKDGAKVILDGRKYRNEKYPEGFYLGPTIMDGVEIDANVNREEIFGPVASVITVNDFDQAIEVINGSKFGNASTIYTRSGHYAREYVQRVNAGNIGINIGVAAPVAYYPFGGRKESFFGDLHPQGGEDHILFFTDSKVVISRWTK